MKMAKDELVAVYDAWQRSCWGYTNRGNNMYRCGALVLAFFLAGCGERAKPLFLQPQVGQLIGADKERGKELIADYGCIACHSVPGVSGPATQVGPPLDKMALRAYLAGLLPNTPGNLVRWLLDPPAVDPRTVMPNMELSEAEARDIAAYLYTID